MLKYLVIFMFFSLCPLFACDHASFVDPTLFFELSSPRIEGVVYSPPFNTIVFAKKIEVGHHTKRTERQSKESDLKRSKSVHFSKSSVVEAKPQDEMEDAKPFINPFAAYFEGTTKLLCFNEESAIFLCNYRPRDRVIAPDAFSTYQRQLHAHQAPTIAEKSWTPFECAFFHYIKNEMIALCKNPPCGNFTPLAWDNYQDVETLHIIMRSHINTLSQDNLEFYYSDSYLGSVFTSLIQPKEFP